MKKNNPLKPQIRFKGYDDEWQQAKVKEVFSLGNGYTPSKANPNFWTNGTIPWFRMEDIRENGRVLADSIQHVTPEAVKSSGLFPAGSIIVSTTATIGEHALLIADSLANQQFTVFQTVNRWSWLNANYLLYRFYGLGDWCRRNVNAGGLAAVSIADLQKYDIDFPATEDERSSIADFFKNLDKLIAEASRELERLEKMKLASLQKMFPRPGASTPEIRFAGFSGNWELIRLDNILGYIQPQPYIVKSTKYVEKGTPVLTAGKSFILGYSDEEFGIFKNIPVILFDDFTTDKRLIDFPFKVKSSAAKILYLKNDSFDIYFIYYFMNILQFEASSHRRYWISDYSQMYVLLPSLDEQRAIGEYFRNIDELIAAKREKLSKLRNIKKSCLAKMFVNSSDL